MAERIGWGVLSTAAIGRHHVVPAIEASANGRVAAVAGRDPARTAEFAAALGIPRIHHGYEALLADPEVDAVYISLPNALHAEWAVRAAEAGKPVLCEKPLAVSAAEARRVVAAFATRGLPLMEGFMYRHHPQHALVRDLVAEGAIGTLLEARAHLSVNLMEPADPRNVRFVPALGGGCLLDMGCYAASVLRGLFAAEPVAAQGRLEVDPRFGVDVAAAGLLAFGAGRTGVMTASFRAGGQGTYALIGSHGTIEVPRGLILGNGTRLGEALVIAVDADGRRREHVLPPVDQYRLMAEAFADAVAGRAPLPYPAADAVANAAVLDAVAASARAGGAAVPVG